MNNKDLLIYASRFLPKNAIIVADSPILTIPILLANKLNKKNIKAVYPSGTINPLTEKYLTNNNPAQKETDTKHVLADLLQAGYIDIGLITGDQVDKYGNINKTVIGPYKSPIKRLSGGGITSDIASLSKETYIFATLNKETFTSLDYLTAPGHLKGHTTRQEAGILGNGPKYIFTDKCIFNFHPKTKKLQLAYLYENTTKKEIKQNLSFHIHIPSTPETIFPPTKQEKTTLTNLLQQKK